MKPLELAIQTYISLLKHPLDTWRVNNQKVYCDLRNFISDETGESCQEVQDKYEEIAFNEKYPINPLVVNDPTELNEVHKNLKQAIYGFAD